MILTKREESYNINNTIKFLKPAPFLLGEGNKYNKQYYSISKPGPSFSGWVLLGHSVRCATVNKISQSIAPINSMFGGTLPSDPRVEPFYWAKLPQGKGGWGCAKIWASNCLFNELNGNS